MNNATTIIRSIVAGVIWTGVLVLGIFGVINGSDSSIPISIVAFITAAVATGFLFNPDNNKDISAAKSSDAKRKNDHSDGLDPLSLLTPDDLDELRQDIKDRLRERILSGEDGELSSLDSLLTDQRKRK